MRKFAAVSSACAVLAGIVGFFLRRRELKTVFDPATGLAEAGAGITWALIALSAAFCAGMIIALVLAGRLKLESGYHGAFGSASPVSFYITALSSLAMLAGAVMLFAKVFKAPELSIVNLVLAVFAAAAAVSVSVMSYAAYMRSRGSETLLCSLVPLAFLCFWLILAYRQRAADPVLLDYVYEVLSLVFSILGFYFAAGFAFDRVKPRRALFCMNGAVYMGIVTLADGHSLAYTLLFVGMIIVMLVDSMLLAGNSRRLK